MGLSLTLEGRGFSYPFSKPLSHQIEKKNLYIRRLYIEQFQELFPTTEFWYNTFLLSSRKPRTISDTFYQQPVFRVLYFGSSTFYLPTALVLRKLQQLELSILISVYWWIPWLIPLLRAYANSLPLLSQGPCVSPQVVLS